MTPSPGIAQLLAADYLVLTVFAPSASRVGTRTATTAIRRFCEVWQPVAATIAPASEAFGRSHRRYSDRTEAMSCSVPIAVTVVDRPPRVMRHLSPLAALLPNRLVLLAPFSELGPEVECRTLTQEIQVYVGAHRRDVCERLIDSAHAHGLLGAWMSRIAPGKRLGEPFHVLPVTVVGEGSRVAAALAADALDAGRGEMAISGCAASASAEERSVARLGGCLLTPWRRIAFTSPSHTDGGAMRHFRVHSAMRAAEGPGATTVPASYGFVQPTHPRRPRLLRSGLPTPITTTIATDEQRLKLCTDIVRKHATASDLITCEAVFCVSSEA